MKTAKINRDYIIAGELIYAKDKIITADDANKNFLLYQCAAETVCKECGVKLTCANQHIDFARGDTGKRPVYFCANPRHEDFCSGKNDDVNDNSNKEPDQILYNYLVDNDEAVVTGEFDEAEEDGNDESDEPMDTPSANTKSVNPSSQKVSTAKNAAHKHNELKQICLTYEAIGKPYQDYSEKNAAWKANLVGLPHSKKRMSFYKGFKSIDYCFSDEKYAVYFGILNKIFIYEEKIILVYLLPYEIKNKDWRPTVIKLNKNYDRKSLLLFKQILQDKAFLAANRKLFVYGLRKWNAKKGIFYITPKNLNFLAFCENTWKRTIPGLEIPDKNTNTFEQGFAEIADNLLKYRQKIYNITHNIQNVEEPAPVVINAHKNPIEKSIPLAPAQRLVNKSNDKSVIKQSSQLSVLTLEVLPKNLDLSKNTIMSTTTGAKRIPVRDITKERLKSEEELLSSYGIQPEKKSFLRNLLTVFYHFGKKWLVFILNDITYL